MTKQAGMFAAALLLCAQAALAQPAERKDLQVFNDVAKAVNRYEQFTIFDDISANVKDGVVTLEGKVTMPYKKNDIEKRVAKVDGVTRIVDKVDVLVDVPTSSVALAIDFEPRALQFPQQSDGLFTDGLELSFFGVSEQGKPTRGTRTMLNLTLRPETYQRVQTAGLRANPRISLPPGRYHKCRPERRRHASSSRHCSGRYRLEDR